MKFQEVTRRKLADLTLGEYQEKKVLELCSRYKVSPITLQRYAAKVFGSQRKRIPSKIAERYASLDWSQNDTTIATTLVLQRVGSKNARMIRHTRERVRQIRSLLGKPRSLDYRKRIPKSS